MSEVLLQELVPVDVIQEQPSSSSSLLTDKRFRGRLLTLKIEAREIGDGKEFVVSVSREEEPCFIYSLSLRRKGYEHLKEEQNLEADFDTFPTMICDFIRDMRDNIEAHLEGHLKEDKSQLRLEMICKMNSYKRVTLLSLKLSALSNQELITYLVSKIVGLKAVQAEMDSVRNCLARETEKNRELKNIISNTATEIIELKLERDKEKKGREEVEKKFEEIQKSLKERDALRKENEEFREQIDNLLDEQERMEEEKDHRIMELEEELDSIGTELEAKEEIIEKHEVELEDLESKFSEQLSELESWKRKAFDLKKERDQLKVECDHWRAEQKKAVEILDRMYRQQRRKSLPEDDHQQRVRELETDLEERKRTIDTLTESISQLRKELDLSRTECEKAQKAAADWETKYEKKDKMLGDFLQLRRSSPITNPVVSPPMDFANGPFLPSYKRVLGRYPTLTGPMSTPLRDFSCIQNSQPVNFANYAPSADFSSTVKGQSQQAVCPPTAPQAPL